MKIERSLLPMMLFAATAFLCPQASAVDRFPQAAPPSSIEAHRNLPRRLRLFTLGFPLVLRVALFPVFAIFPLFLLAAPLLLFPFFASITHSNSPSHATVIAATS